MPSVSPHVPALSVIVILRTTLVSQSYDSTL